MLATLLFVALACGVVSSKDTTSTSPKLGIRPSSDIRSPIFNLSEAIGKKPRPAAPAVLPPGVCYWRQKLIYELRPWGEGVSSSPAGATCTDRYTFKVRHQDFLEILGPSPELKLEATVSAHEGGVYYPNKNEIFFTSTRVGTRPVKLQKFNLRTKVVRTVMEDTDFANGLALDNQGDLLVCEQGRDWIPGRITRINPITALPTILADNWFNIPFSSPNDVVVKSDGSIWFTDPDYGSVQGFREKPKMNNQVYRIDPVTGIVDVVADKFVKPNGLAFSPDEKRLYVTDTGFALGTGDVDIEKPHDITVFDVVDGRILRNRNFFTAVAHYDGSGLGIPDGIKVDTRGNVYVAAGDGIQVFNEDAVPLGLIVVPGAANMGFAGPKLDTLYILNDTAIHSVKLRATAAGLAYAAGYHNLQPPHTAS